MTRYRHKTITTGQITHDEDSYPVVDHVVDLPDHVAAGVPGLEALPALLPVPRQEGSDPSPETRGGRKPRAK